MLATALYLSFLSVVNAGASIRTHARGRDAGVGITNTEAVYVPDVISDFQKNNVSAKWAEGQPKEWGTEDAKYAIRGSAPDTYASADTTADDKYLVISDLRKIEVIGLDTGTVVSTYQVPSNASVSNGQLRISPLVGNGYTVLLALTDWRFESVYQLQLSSNGTVTGEPIVFEGTFSSFDWSPYSNDGKRFLTVSGKYAYINTIGDPTATLTLPHNDSVMSTAFDSTGKYVSTAAWDSYARIWDARTGAVLKTYGPTTGQNWLTNFSPDGSLVLVTVGTGVAHLFPSSNSTGSSIELTGYGKGDWIRSAAWSPDGQYLATGSSGKVFVWKIPEAQLVQSYRVESGEEINGLDWLKEGKQLSYRLLGGGLEVYDLETNLKYRFGPSELDHYTYGVYPGSTHVLKSKGWIGGIDSDSKVRFWKWSA